MSHPRPGQGGHDDPSAVTARSRFDHWLCSVANGGDVEEPGRVQRLLLEADTSLMSAAARLCLPGADAPTYAHAVRLLQLLCDRGIATNWATACARIGELPAALLHEYTEAIDADLMAAEPIGSDMAGAST